MVFLVGQQLSRKKYRASYFDTNPQFCTQSTLLVPTSLSQDPLFLFNLPVKQGALGHGTL